MIFEPYFCRWSFLIGDEPCTVVNKPAKAPSPVIEEIEVEEGLVGEDQQVEVIIEEVKDDKEEEQEKAEVEPTKVHT